MPRIKLVGQREDLVWSQLLTPGMEILAEADVLEVVAAEVVESAEGDHVEVTVCSIDGSTFDRNYPMDHLVPTIPRTFSQAA
jgi:hypothetical protein